MPRRNLLRTVSEQFIQPFQWFWFSGVRTTFRVIGNTFWPRSHPAEEGTVVNFDMLRKLYRNSGENALGAGFAKPIIDLQVGFIGTPVVTVEDEALDEFLNQCVTVYWQEQLQQMVRDSLRDSKVIVRLRKPDILDPLMTLEEAQHCTIECLPPERVDLEYNFRNKNVIERATVIHRMTIVISEGDPTVGLDPVQEEHDIIEFVTRDSYRFFDRNTGQWISDMETPNPWGFVPFLECHNEWDAALQGGQSDLESVIPFLNAFHDVVAQGLTAHRYHSTPKLKMKLVDVAPFIKNNFPDAWDDQLGRVKNGAEVNWHGREIIFFQAEEDADFLEAQSVLGDTKALADFLIDCISISSQTPSWAFMYVSPGAANQDRNAQTLPFLKKIEKKRRNYSTPIKMLCKMALVAHGEIPYMPKVTWEIVRADDQLVVAQAFQQILMGLEVAAQRGEISDQTYRETIRQFLPLMLGAAAERAAVPVPQIPVASTSSNGNVPAQQPAISAGAQGRGE